MNTLNINTRQNSNSNASNQNAQATRSKLMSAAEVWFIQRQKRARVQRRYIL